MNNFYEKAIYKTENICGGNLLGVIESVSASSEGVKLSREKLSQVVLAILRPTVTLQALVSVISARFRPSPPIAYVEFTVSGVG